MEEIWRDIKDYEGYYQVSNRGIVKSLNYNHTGKEGIMKPHDNGKGYLRVQLCKDGKGKWYRINRLVAQAFLPNPNNLPEVNHIDGNPKNNNVNNLEWCDRKTNLELSSVGFTRNKFKCYIEEVSSGKKIKEFETIKSACEWASENLGCSKSYLQRKTGNISNGYRVMKV